MATVEALTPGAVTPGTFLGQKSAGMGEGAFSAWPTEMPSPSGTPTGSNTNVQPTKLFIGGISRRTTTKQLRDHFSKTGRVLDCVAMRTPDGRPRGFGYVTLDSPEAAESFLSEPQMIDDRIVDMKRAVPEAHTPKASPSQLLLGTAAPGMMDPMSMQGLYSQHGMFYGGHPWADQSGFYCDGGFAGLSDMGMQLPAAEPMEYSQPSVTSPHGVPDCVDLLTGFLLPGFDFPASQENMSPTQAPLASEFLLAQQTTPKSKKTPLGEVTNLMAGTALQPISENKPAAAPEGILHEPVKKPYKPQRIEASSPLGFGGGSPCFVFEDASPSTEAPSPEEADLSPEAPSADLSPQAPSIPPTPVDASLVSEEANNEGLPSLGSAQHASGECRRCNFFAKGRCRNGVDCVFCHFPHERRKLSRQEKREQQAARQNGGSDSCSDSSSEDEDDSAMPKRSGLLLSPARARAPPGLSLDTPNQQSEFLLAPLPAPAAVAGTTALPPGLRPPGLPTPAAAAPAAATGRSPWEAAKVGAGMLSTSPSSSVGGVSSLFLSTTPTATPMAGVVAGGMLKSAPKAAWKEMRSVETQTDDDFTCPYCEECREDSLQFSSPLSPKRCECAPEAKDTSPATPKLAPLCKAAAAAIAATAAGGG